MRVVSWNMHGAPGGATNAQQVRAWHYLAALDADVMLLQEVRAAAVPEWVAETWNVVLGAPGVLGKTAGWGSAVGVRTGMKIQDSSRLKDPSSWMSLVYDYVIAIDVEVGSDRFFLASVHAPAVSAKAFLGTNLPNEGALSDETLAGISIEPNRPWSTDVVFHALERARGQRFVIGGDWNTSRLFDRDKKVPTNALFFARAVEFGWCEAMGAMNEQRSFFRDGNLPYQLDHIFVDRDTQAAARACSVWADPLAIETSDHAPVVLELDFSIVGDS